MEERDVGTYNILEKQAQIRQALLHQCHIQYSQEANNKFQHVQSLAIPHKRVLRQIFCWFVVQLILLQF